MQSKLILIALSFFIVSIILSSVANASLAICRVPAYEGICCLQYSQDILWPSGNGMCCGGLPYSGATVCPWAKADCMGVTCNPKCDGNIWDFLGWCIVGGQCLYWTQNCDAFDGCYNATAFQGEKDTVNSYYYRNYYCASGPLGCAYTADDCRDCSCICYNYKQEESIFAYNCYDERDNDCDGSCDTNGCLAPNGTALPPDPKCGLTLTSMADITAFCPYDSITHTHNCTAQNVYINNSITLPSDSGYGYRNIIFDVKDKFIMKGSFYGGSITAEANETNISGSIIYGSRALSIKSSSLNVSGDISSGSDVTLSAVNMNLNNIISSGNVDINARTINMKSISSNSVKINANKIILKDINSNNINITAFSVTLQNIPTSITTEIKAQGLITANIISGNTVRLKSDIYISTPTLSGSDIRIDVLGDLNISNPITSSYGKIFLRGANTYVKAPITNPSGTITIVGDEVNITNTVSSAGYRGTSGDSFMDGKDGGKMRIYATNLNISGIINMKGGDSYGSTSKSSGCAGKDTYCGNGGNGGDMRIYAENYDVKIIETNININKGLGNCWAWSVCYGYEERCLCGTTTCGGYATGAYCNGLWGNDGSISKNSRITNSLFAIQSAIKQAGVNHTGSFLLKVMNPYLGWYVYDQYGNEFNLTGRITNGWLSKIIGLDKQFKFVLGKTFVIELRLSDDSNYNQARCDSGTAKCETELIYFSAFVD